MRICWGPLQSAWLPVRGNLCAVHDHAIKSREAPRSAWGTGVKDCMAGLGSSHRLLALEVRPWCRHAATHGVRAAAYTP